MKKFIPLLSVTAILLGVALEAPAEQKFPYLGEVTTNDVVIRAGQSSNFENLGRLSKGEEVVVVNQNYSWLKIKLPVHAESFVSVDFISDLGGRVGEATGHKVNIRAGPGTQYYVIGQLSQGERIRIIDTKDKWYKIEPVDQSYGWVMADYVKFKSTSIPAARLVQAPPAPIHDILKRTAGPQPSLVLVSSEEASSSKQVITLGIVDDLGDKVLSDSIRHKLIVDDKTVYLLKGFRRVIDGFLHHKVKVEGEVVEAGKTEHPVILVTKISLVL